MQQKTDVYSDYASQYVNMVARRGEEAGIERDPVMPTFLKSIGDVSGLSVLDAGCGEGYLARALTRRGARVTGIDISPRLIEFARAQDPAGTIEYREADLCKPLADEYKAIYQDHFDLVASFFVLNDVYDYQIFLANLGMVTRPGGRAVLFLNNPYSLIVRNHLSNYFDSGRVCSYRGMAEQGVKVFFHHHTLQEYLDASFAAGFQLERLIDLPMPAEGSFKRYADILIPVGHQFPFFMILSLLKP